MKRAFDVIISGFALLCLAPLFGIVAIAVVLNSRGPVLFSQVRVGKRCGTFNMLKFRSMVEKASEIGPYFTASADPRITRVGRWLRRSSIDELPQLLNVLLGDMSIVGPRPDVPQQQALYTPEEWQQRHRVRPGLTGPAQASLRSEATLDERKSMDLAYAQGASFFCDLAIIMTTLKQVFRKGGN